MKSVHINTCPILDGYGVVDPCMLIQFLAGTCILVVGA
jgi:hypothetical protein